MSRSTTNSPKSPCKKCIHVSKYFWTTSACKLCLNGSVFCFVLFFNAQAGLHKPSDQAVEQPTKSILGYLISDIIEY